MVKTYFEIGKMIVEDEQKGEERAEYGKQILKNLSAELTKEYGRGFLQILEDGKQELSSTKHNGTTGVPLRGKIKPTTKCHNLNSSEKETDYPLRIFTKEVIGILSPFVSKIKNVFL